MKGNRKLKTHRGSIPHHPALLSDHTILQIAARIPASNRAEAKMKPAEADFDCNHVHDRKKKKYKSKSAKRDDRHLDDSKGVDDSNDTHYEKKKKKDKKRKKERESDNYDGGKKRKQKKRRYENSDVKNHESKPTYANQKTKKKYFPFEYEHIVAPMVGASELAFRLLSRKYGATLAYTPMMSASQFVDEASSKNFTSEVTVANSNICEFQTIPEDRPLVCHFSANNPVHFANAAKLVEPYCDAIDLNLGCPQRTAFVGHFGSYLLGSEDRCVHDWCLIFL